MGRPTKYKPEYCQQMIDYFSVEPYKTVTKTVASQGKAVQIEVEEASDIPLYAGFCVEIDVDRDTLNRMAQKA